MSLNSTDGGRAPGGAVGGAAPRLSGLAYAHWAPLFVNWAIRNGVEAALQREIPELAAKLAAAERWEQEAEDSAFLAALGGSSSSSSPPMKAEEKAAEAAGAAATQASRAKVLQTLTRSKRVYAAIYEAIPEELRAQIPSTAGDAFGLWSWLRGKFQSTEADSVGALFKEWSTIAMEPAESFDAYRARVNKLRSLLLAAKESISHAHFTYVLLDRLQPRYTPVVLALKAGGALKDTAAIDWDAVTAMINSHERSEQQMGGASEEEKAMGAFAGSQKGKRQRHSSEPPSSASSGRDKPKPWHKDLVCDGCKQKGHIRRFCTTHGFEKEPLAQGQGQQRRSNNRETAASATKNTRNGAGKHEQSEDTEGESDYYAFSVLAVRGAAPAEKKFAELGMGLTPMMVGGATNALPVSPARVVTPSPFAKQSIDAMLASTCWGMDSMASCHVSGNKALFKHLRKCSPVEIKTADGTVLTCEQRGTVPVQVITAAGKDIKIELDVMYSERFTANLLSTITLTDLNGWKMNLEKGNTYAVTPEGNRINLSTRNRVAVMESSGMERACAIPAANGKVICTADAFLSLHERLAHMSFDALVDALKRGVTLDLGTLQMNAEELQKAKQRCMDCAACVSAKGTRQPLGQRGLDRGSDVIEALHADSFEVKVDDRTEYGLSVHNPFSSAQWFARVDSKDQLPQKLVDIMRRVQTQTGKMVKRLHTDGGSEFINATVKTFCRENGTELHWSPAGTPQLNGVAERSVRLLKEGGRVLLEHARLPKRYWAHAMSHFVYVWNRSKVNKETGVTPIEATLKVKPSARYLGVFGCDVWVFSRDKKQTFDSKTEPGVYLGHDDAQNCPVVLLITRGKVVRSKDVRFRKQTAFEHAAALWGGQDAIDRAVSAPLPPVEDVEEPFETQDTDAGAQSTGLPKPEGVSTGTASGGVSSTSETRDSSGSGQYEVKRILDKSGKGPRTKYLVEWVGYPKAEDRTWQSIQSLRGAKRAIDEYENGTADTDDEIDRPLDSVVQMVMCTVGREQLSGVEERTIDSEILMAVSAAIRRLETPGPAPETYRQAMESPEAGKWSDAMDKEMNSCEAAGTWKRVRRADLPAGANVIPCKWVYKVKNDETDTVTEHKARLTPKGFKQQKGVDYKEVFARTGMYKTMRVGLALTAAWGHELDQMDVPSAFLNAPIEEELYMEMPEGYQEDGIVLKLEKALYGLKQAPRAWYLLLREFLLRKEKKLLEQRCKEGRKHATAMGFTECVSDPCLFWRRTRSGRLILLFLFVDDMQISYHHADKAEWNELKTLLVERFRTKDMGQSKWILGMRIQRDREAGTLTLDQELYVSKALERFGLSECRTISTPAVSSSEKEDDQDGGGAPCDQAKYMEIVGTLLYATISTRPDISYAVQRLTRHMQAPLKRHMVAAERTLRYLAGAKELGLLFGRVHSKKKGDEDLQLTVEAFADADWANDKLDRKSITGWVAKLNGDVVSWASKKQRTVAQSTCEAELYAEAAAFNEVLWLRGLLLELQLLVAAPSLVMGDNQSAIALSEHGVKSERTKHVDVKYHFITDEIAKGAVKVKWVPSEEQQADIFTKALAAPVFELLRGQLMTR